jgi:hypothetical protein
VISQSRYIDITSGVGAGATVAERKLILRIITQNTTIPPGVVLEADDADSVGTYFGTSSEEYLRAAAYFGFISKSTVSPALISFCRWVSTDIAPMVVGDTLTKSITDFAAVTSGLLTISVGNATTSVTGIALSTATDLTAAAATIQAAIRAAGTSESQLATATVTFNTNTNQFVLTGSVTGSGAITVTASGNSGDISTLLGWATSGTVFVSGQTADEPNSAISKSASISNNFGSFLFANSNGNLTNSQVAEVALWNDDQNEMYMYSVPTSLSNLGTLYALVKGYSGCALTIVSSSLANDYAEQSPCEIFAATNYNATNGVQNYMFYQFDSRNITVSDDTTANTADASRGNYIGVTQSAGQQIAFYQRGILCGGSADATDMNTYANEIWLKSAITAKIMALFLAVNAIPANPTGVSQLLAVIQSVLTLALTNGTFSAGKTLTTIQQQYITSNTGDSNAWRQVQTLGYWFNLTYTSYVNSNTNLTEYKAVYTLIYSKGDNIRLVDGTDTMI